MKISIFGMGYVGTVSGICLASGGHEVVGVDVNSHKVSLINEGKCPIIEKDLPELMHGVHENKSFRATDSVADAVRLTEISFICVGTPGNGNGNQDNRYVKRVCAEIGSALSDKRDRHVIVVRSTLIPGSMESLVIPTLEDASGKRAGGDFDVFFNPEFMREGNSVQDFFHPPMTIIGGPEGPAMEKVSAVYSISDAPLIKTNYGVAETIKYVCNIFHALKIAFANEIGVICKAMGIDSHEVMDIFCLDNKLNISKAYLKPGFAFGGSCLPKDLRALNYKAKEFDIEIPLLQSILSANRVHIQRTLDLVCGYGRKKVGVIGLSFKPGTDDLRESPMVTLVETLIGKGYPLRIFDRNISLARLTGSNKMFIENEIPHISSILVDDLPAMLDWAELIIAGTGEGAAELLTLIKPEQVVIDLARVFDPKKGPVCPAEYHGVCW